MTEAERRQRLWAALLCGSLGLFLIYVVWSRQPGLRVPPAVGYLAGGVFVAAGTTLLLQASGYMRAAVVPAFLTAVGLAGVGGWIGFGPGSRRCQGGLGDLPFVPGELVCRAVFGVGAVLTALIAVLMLRSLVKSKPKPPQRAV
jgi:hypothetical protein